MKSEVEFSFIKNKKPVRRFDDWTELQEARNTKGKKKKNKVQKQRKEKHEEVEEKYSYA